MKINKKIIALMVALAVTAAAVLIPCTDTADKSYAAEEKELQLEGTVDELNVGLRYNGSNEATIYVSPGTIVKLSISIRVINQTAIMPGIVMPDFNKSTGEINSNYNATWDLGPVNSEGDHIIQSGDYAVGDFNAYRTVFTLHIRFKSSSDPTVPSDPSGEPGPSGDTTYDDWLWYVENVLNKPAEPEPELPNEFETAVNDANAQLENALNRLQALLAAGDTAGVKDLMSKGITIDTGRLSCFRVNTYELIYKVTQAGIPVTLNFIYENKPYAITIPAYTKINPATLCDDKGFSGFLNLAVKYGIRPR